MVSTGGGDRHGGLHTFCSDRENAEASDRLGAAPTSHMMPSAAGGSVTVSPPALTAPPAAVETAAASASSARSMLNAILRYVDVRLCLRLMSTDVGMGGAP